jgi:hypothetical protein
VDPPADRSFSNLLLNGIHSLECITDGYWEGMLLPTPKSGEFTKCATNRDLPLAAELTCLMGMEFYVFSVEFLFLHFLLICTHLLTPGHSKHWTLTPPPPPPQSQAVALGEQFGGAQHIGFSMIPCCCFALQKRAEHNACAGRTRMLMILGMKFCMVFELNSKLKKKVRSKCCLISMCLGFGAASEDRAQRSSSGVDT